MESVSALMYCDGDMIPSYEGLVFDALVIQKSS